MNEIWKDTKVIESSNDSVKKYVFTKDDAVAEAVLYKYPTYDERTVICCSTQSGCPVGCRFCLDPDTNIQTPGGDKKIKDLKVGDLVMGQDKNGQNSVQTIEELFINDYDDEIIEIELENGNTMKITPNHEVNTLNGWKRADELKETDELIAF